MGDAFSILTPAATACLIMAPVHCSFGLHIVRRGLIFIDLAIAQVAALGVAFALSKGYEVQSAEAHWYSLGFGSAAALLFAATRFHHRRVPHEAIIGIVYAVASAATLVVLDPTPHGGEEMKAILVGNILFVGWPDIRKTAVLYASIMLIFYLCRRHFTAITDVGETPVKNRLAPLVWDFVFYSLLALVVTSSVQIAGVLIVFIWLVIPAVAAFLYVEDMRSAFQLAVGFSYLTSLCGLLVSWQADWPTGASVVVIAGLGLVLVSLPRLFSGSYISLKHKQSARSDDNSLLNPDPLRQPGGTAEE